MSTTGGPKLEGIGRGGASNLVLEMDAHDAKSYPGEPTTNLFPQPSLASASVGTTWSGNGGTWGTSTATVESVMGPDGKYIKAVSNQHTASGGGTAHIWFFYNYLSGMGSAQRDLTLTNGTTYTCSWWWKANESRTATSNNIYFVGVANVSTGGSNIVTTEWSKASITFTFGGTTGTYNPGHYFYNVGDSTAVGFKVWYAMLQIEEKTYATPAVRSQLSGFGQQGYNARPASVNLMIHGNVGTGTSFEDSSPEKNVLTTINSLGHGGVSKFSGGSLGKFTRGSSQYIEVASTDAANFGTGDWTVDYWFNMTSGQTDRMHAINIGTYATSNLSFNFNDGNAFWLYWNGSGSPNIIFGSDGDYGDGAWHHMAVTRASGMIRIWVDGVHKGSNNYNSSISMGTTTTIGVGGPSPYWDGYLDEVRITKGTALWVGSGNFTPPTRRNRNAPVVDLSGSDNGGNFNTKDMTDVATYRDGQVIEPVASAVWDFDGTDDKILINTKPFDLKCFTIAIKQERGGGFYPGTTSQVNLGVAIGTSGYNGIVIGDWTGTMDDETLSWWGYGSGGSGSSATYIKDEIAVGWHIFTFNWNGSDYDIWVDGTKRTTYARGGGSGHSGLLSGVTAIYPGWSSGWTTSYFIGQIGSLRAFDVSLTDQQVKQNFNSQRSRFKV
jgi:hypothetical protein